jgi:hypothetical protein
MPVGACQCTFRLADRVTIVQGLYCRDSKFVTVAIRPQVAVRYNNTKQRQVPEVQSTRIRLTKMDTAFHTRIVRCGLDIQEGSMSEPLMRVRRSSISFVIESNPMQSQ